MAESEPAAATATTPIIPIPISEAARPHARLIGLLPLAGYVAAAFLPAPRTRA